MDEFGKLTDKQVKEVKAFKNTILCSTEQINNIIYEVQMNLEELSQKVLDMEELQRKIDHKEDELKELKNRHREYSEEIIPEIMEELSLAEIKLESGEKISIQTQVFASIPTKNRSEALNWLRGNGYGDLIKNKIDLTFGKGEDNLADRVKADLINLQVPFKENETVHPQTLKAFAKEQVMSGNLSFPWELFGTFTKRITKVKR